MNIRILFVSFILILCPVFNGCVATLKSEDSQKRMEAINSIKDEEELFLIAMNLKIDVDRCSGSFCDAFLRSESYYDDVRVAAVKKLENPILLVRCASWSDGEMFHYDRLKNGVLVYNGRNYWVHDSGCRMRQHVNPGDCVRRAAAEKLSQQRMFAELVQTLCFIGRDRSGGKAQKGGASFRSVFFPGKESYFVGGVENDFVDGYAGVKYGNPIDRLFSELIRQQGNQSLLSSFIAASISNGLVVYPSAMEAAIEKIDGSDRDAVVRVFEALTNQDVFVPNAKKVIAKWAWQMLYVMDNPSIENMIFCVKAGYGEKDSLSPSEKAFIDEIAEKKIIGCVWGKCYLEELFDGYSRERMIKNINDELSAIEVLIKARKMLPDHVDSLLQKIKDLVALKKIKKECYLKIVDEKTDLAIFNKEYRKLLDDLSKTDDVVLRAILSKNYKEKLKRSSVSIEEKVRIFKIIENFIHSGIVALEKTGDLTGKQNFSLRGFYLGMPNSHAKFLYDVKYENEQITWVVDKDGLISQLNFGSDFLRKVYRFNVDTYEEWISCLSRKIGRRFSSAILEDEKRPVGGRGTVIRVKQNVWTSKDHLANMTITYFGEKSVTEIEPNESGFVERVYRIARGVTFGDVVKELVLEGSRHWANKEWDKDVGGAPGMLRIGSGISLSNGASSRERNNGKNALDRTLDSATDSWNAIKDTAPVIEGFINNVFK